MYENQDFASKEADFSQNKNAPLLNTIHLASNSGAVILHIRL